MFLATMWGDGESYGALCKSCFAAAQSGFHKREELCFVPALSFTSLGDRAVGNEMATSVIPPKGLPKVQPRRRRFPEVSQWG